MGRRVDRTGEYLISGLGAGVTVRRLSGEPFTICPLGTYAQWLDDEARIAIYQALDGGVARIEVCDTNTRERFPVRMEGCNELAAGGGRWVAWRRGKGLFGYLGDQPEAGNAAPRDDGRGAVGRDGTIAIMKYRDPRPDQRNFLELHAPDGSTFTLPDIYPYDVRVVGPTAATWTYGSAGVTPAPLRDMLGAIRLAGKFGVWWVGYFREMVVAHSDDLRQGHIVTRGPAFHLDAEVTDDGRIAVGFSTGAGELPYEGVIIPDARTMPVIDLMRVDVPPINAPFRLGWFEYQPNTTPAPGTCHMQVWDGMIVEDGRAIAQYIQAEAEGNTPQAFAAAHAAARKRHPALPTFAYWSNWDRGGPAPVCDIVGVQVYPPARMDLSTYESEVRDVLIRTPRSAIVAMCYTSNTGNTSDLEGIVPMYARLARYAREPMMLVFSNSGKDSGRATGLQDHPEVRYAWEALWNGITGTPRPPVVVAEPTQPGGGGGGNSGGSGSGGGNEEPKEQELIDMRIIDGEVYNTYWIPAATALSKELYPDVSEVEIAQSIREESDRIRGIAGRNATLWEVLNAPSRRESIRALPKQLSAVDQDAFMRRVAETERGLRR